MRNSTASREPSLRDVKSSTPWRFGSYLRCQHATSAPQHDGQSLCSPQLAVELAQIAADLGAEAVQFNDEVLKFGEVAILRGKDL